MISPFFFLFHSHLIKRTLIRAGNHHAYHMELELAQSSLFHCPKNALYRSRGMFSLRIVTRQHKEKGRLFLIISGASFAAASSARLELQGHANGILAEFKLLAE